MEPAEQPEPQEEPKIVKAPRKNARKEVAVKKVRPKGRNLIVPNSRMMFENVDALIDGRFYCRICSSTYKTVATLVAHLRQIHLKSESICQEPGCDHHAMTRSERQRHQKIHDNERYQKMLQKQMEKDRSLMEVPMIKSQLFPDTLQQNNKEIQGMFKSFDVEKSKVMYTCQVCAHNFHHPFHAAKHVECHNKAPESCYYCGSIRNGALDVQMHNVKKHQKDAVRVYKCAKCAKQYTSFQAFQQHWKVLNRTGCKQSDMTQDVYFGELPDTVIIDGITQQLVDQQRQQNLMRKKMLENADPEKLMVPIAKTMLQKPAPISPTNNKSDNFYFHALPTMEMGEKMPNFGGGAGAQPQLYSGTPVYMAQNGAYFYHAPQFFAPNSPPAPQFFATATTAATSSQHAAPISPTFLFVPAGAAPPTKHPFLTPTHTPPAPSYLVQKEPSTSISSQDQPTKGLVMPCLSEFGMPSDCDDFGIDLLNDDPDFSKVFSII
ncbi:unnamed protein product [Caenorhabditis angaria]|uniref:C2H2-type domain-containing protein n=1 Tax=Caenorhabditis angaria TaxID=860376 RepID=A0A9P1IJG6_9PELO|nr:unnamed protein product [Caenorhabditis angaria]